MIEFKQVCIKYAKEYFSLCDFNLKINKNCIVVGDEIKLTALARCLAKLDNFYSGEIFVDNINIKKIKPKNLSLAYLPSTPVYFKHKTVKQNLIYPLKIRKIDKQTRQAQVEKIFAELNCKNEKIKNLSFAQQQLVCLARAILWQPKYIVLEKFFDDCNEKFYNSAFNLLNNTNSTIIILTEKPFEFNCNYKTINIEK